MNPKTLAHEAPSPADFARLVNIVQEAAATASYTGISFSEVIEAAAPEYKVIDRDRFADIVAAAEENEDRRAVEAAAAGEGEYLPAEMVRRMIAGESPVRAWRGHRGLSQQDLALAAGIGKSFLCQIESGKKNGSLATMRALATALAVDLDDLV